MASRTYNFKSYFVYILTNKKRGVIYIGVTSNLANRINEHREGSLPGFTQKYELKTLVHYEVFDDINSAIAREKQLKRWHREWKINLIEKNNPDWMDLYAGLIEMEK